MFLAHSALNGQPSQLYRSHVSGVVASVQNNLSGLIRFIPSEKQIVFQDVLIKAATFHDLGKLDEENQAVLRDEKSHAHLPIEHRDAGVKYLLELLNNRNAAVMVYAHHRPGLPNLMEERVKENPFRFSSAKNRTDSYLDDYLQIHTQEVGKIPDSSIVPEVKLNAIDYRMLLSCLVDADYSDTAGIKVESFPTRWEKRIQKLDQYVTSLNNKTQNINEKESVRNGLRQEMYTCCKEAPPTTNIIYCDSPVGTGKTTAVMAHLLQIAKERNLRHIIVVLPYTNIITQAVETYRKALVLEGEDPCKIIAEHHHQADYDSRELRHLASTWSSPITVTTAVQFFESLASNIPSKLRKIHQLPGSAVFLDENHAMLPAELMLSAWNWIKELSEKWGCYFCLCSGTTMKFWELSYFSEHIPIMVEPLLTETMIKKLYDFESKRISTESLSFSPPHFENSQHLISYIASKKGPRLVVMNTVQSAAALANDMRQMGYDVLHLSTALTPEDREYVLNEVRKRLSTALDESIDNNWTLVATSCVECGLNLSFRNGFCELRSLQSYLQLGGRINRDTEYIGDSSLNIFTVSDPLFNSNPLFNRSISVLHKLINSGNLPHMSITEAVTQSFDMECKEAGQLTDLIYKNDKKCAFIDVAQNFRVIDDDTVTVVANYSIINKLEIGEDITPFELMKGSVNIRRAAVKKLNLQPILGHSEIMKLTDQQYDSFLGYAKALLKIDDITRIFLYL